MINAFFLSDCLPLLHTDCPPLFHSRDDADATCFGVFGYMSSAIYETYGLGQTERINCSNAFDNCLEIGDDLAHPRNPEDMSFISTLIYNASLLSQGNRREVVSTAILRPTNAPSAVLGECGNFTFMPNTTLQTLTDPALSYPYVCQVSRGQCIIM